MKSKKGLLSVFIFGALIAICTVGAVSVSGPVFEYKVIYQSANLGELLNREGKEGWELVAVTENRGASLDTILYLKRRVK